MPVVLWPCAQVPCGDKESMLADPKLCTATCNGLLACKHACTSRCGSCAGLSRTKDTSGESAACAAPDAFRTAGCHDHPGLDRVTAQRGTCVAPAERSVPRRYDCARRRRGRHPQTLQPALQPPAGVRPQLQGGLPPGQRMRCMRGALLDPLPPCQLQPQVRRGMRAVYQALRMELRARGRLHRALRRPLRQVGGALPCTTAPCVRL